MNDPFNLNRFVTAQLEVYDQALREISDGDKRSHWMGFIFPHLPLPNMSDVSRYYAISGIEEAKAYLRHGVLGPRLIECTSLVNHHPGRCISRIFHTADSLRFHASMTLFARAAYRDSEFSLALDRYFDGQREGSSHEILRSQIKQAEHQMQNRLSPAAQRLAATHL